MSAEERWDTMTPEAYPPPPPTEPVVRALHAYKRRFPRAPEPHLAGRDLPTEERILRSCPRWWCRRRPVNAWLIERVTGGWRRDPGPNVQFCGIR